ATSERFSLYNSPTIFPSAVSIVVVASKINCSSSTTRFPPNKITAYPASATATINAEINNNHFIFPGEENILFLSILLLLFICSPQHMIELQPSEYIIRQKPAIRKL